MPGIKENIEKNTLSKLLITFHVYQPNDKKYHRTPASSTCTLIAPKKLSI
jgi:hypothetical protein